MKYLFLVIALFIGPVCMAHSDENFIKSDLFGNLGERDKAAILIIHFGTTHDDTRVLTIDAINAKMKEAFPGIEVREAWTSRIILKKLKERGVERLNPTQALIQLHEQGYTHILIQSTNIIEGTEMKELRREVEGLSLNFKDIRVGNPLLYAPEDYAVVVKAITEAMNQADRGGQKLLVGHGTPFVCYVRLYAESGRTSGISCRNCRRVSGIRRRFAAIEKRKIQNIDFGPPDVCCRRSC